MKICITWVLSLVSLTSVSQTISHVDFITGSRFLYDDFIEGTVYFDDNTQAADLPMRLNLFHDELQYLKNDSMYALATPSRFDKITIGGEAFVYLDESYDSDLAGFVKMWNAQLPAIVTKMRIELREGDYYYAIPPRFERDDDQHYFMRAENDIVEIKSVKHLIYLLSYYSPELEEFAEKEKISSTSGADLAWLVEYHRKIEAKTE